MSQINLEVSKNDPIVLELGFNFVAPSIGSAGGGSTIDSIEVLSPLLNTWTLAAIPSTPHLSKFFINGQKQILGIDYVINGAQVSWLGYALKPSFKIEIYYS